MHGTCRAPKSVPDTPPPLPSQPMAQVLALDALRTERVLSVGGDRTCRLWKIPEETQLIFRGYHPVIESCAFTKGGEWVTGAADGALGLWSAARKKPLQSIRAAHSAEADASPLGSIGGNAAAGVLSVAVCPASDLVVGTECGESGALCGCGGVDDAACGLPMMCDRNLLAIRTLTHASDPSVIGT